MSMLGLVINGEGRNVLRQSRHYGGIFLSFSASLSEAKELIFTSSNSPIPHASKAFELTESKYRISRITS